MKAHILCITGILLLVFSIGGGSAAEVELKIIPGKPANGVYFTYTGLMTTVLELKDGAFRYWFESDAKILPEPTYPLSGKYTIEKNRIILDHDQVSQKEWTFREINNTLTLWRSDALEMDKGKKTVSQYLAKDFKFFKRYGSGSILIPTKVKAVNVWKDRTAPTRYPTD